MTLFQVWRPLRLSKIFSFLLNRGVNIVSDVIIIALVSTERERACGKLKREPGGSLSSLADSFLDVSLRRCQHFADTSEALFVLSDDPGEIHRNIFWLDAELFLALWARNKKHELEFFHNFIASCN